MSERRWLAWWGGSPRSLLFDVLVALGPIAGELYSHGGRLPDSSPQALAALVASFCALLVRRRFPLPVAVVAALVNLPAGNVVGVAQIALYTVAGRRGPGAATWTAAAVNALASAFVMNWHLASVVSGLLFVGVPVLLGLWVYGRQRVLADYDERAEQVERERELLAERAVVAERREIAREMHDVVAHRIGVVSRRAEALAANAPDERSAELAEIIRSTGETAMTELHDMLRALRDDTGTDPAAGDLTGIADLVEDAKRAGENVQLTTPDQLPEVSPEVARAAYRVVQESLTNAAKHAPHAAVHAELTTDEHSLTITVTNRRSPKTRPTALPTSGFGLVGMRERVVLTGGKLHTTRTPEGGYQVRAHLPHHPDLAVRPETSPHEG
ncbi:sensor histidine kinase [Saccharopolyspora griseoalba]|uniref:histidine kinase n=1 Tax=Saccharopolyspora griseoalba TaxID=1431848 RepID=A0ABW2LIH7_9PSEU